jgi:hypothetical protein
LANDITGNIDIQASDVSVNLDRHTVTGRITIEGHIGNNTGNPSLLKAHVYNGRIVSGKVGVVISGSSCLVNDLNINVGQSGTPIWIEHGSYNRVQGCVLSVPTGKTGRSVFNLFLTRHNTVLNNTLSGIYYDTILKDNQAWNYGTNVGVTRSPITNSLIRPSRLIRSRSFRVNGFPVPAFFGWLTFGVSGYRHSFLI